MTIDTMKTAEEWEEIAKTEYRSPSQLNEYTKCPYAYYLARRKKVWKRPAAWLAHGTAVHEAVQLWEESGRTLQDSVIVDLAEKSYRKVIAEDLKDTPNARVWSSSGPYRGPDDIPRRHKLVGEHALNVIRFYREHPDEKPWIDPAGKVWVEKEFKVQFGNVWVVGYVDVVIYERPRDYKTGNTPGDDSQLATYAGALNVLWDVPFTTADYFMAKLGRPTRPYDLSSWSVGRLADEYGQLDEDIRAERFDPNPSPEVCGRCSVNTSCEFAQVG